MLSVERAVVIIEKCSEALVYAHEKKRVHGDVKPGNILLTKKGEVKLSDFGVAKVLDKSRAAVASQPSDYERMLGSSTYSAPEVLEGHHRDFQSDLFSLGILAYVLLSGKHPFMHVSGMSSIPELIKSSTYAVPKLREIRPEINEGYERIVHGLLEKDKEKRYKTAKKVLEDWRAVKMYVKCPKCSTETPVSYNYCGICGSKLMLKQTQKRKESHTAKCPKCGATVEAEKTWKMAGRPDKSGKRTELTIGFFNCLSCGSFRKVLKKRSI